MKTILRSVATASITALLGFANITSSEAHHINPKTKKTYKREFVEKRATKIALYSRDVNKKIEAITSSLNF